MIKKHISYPKIEQFRNVIYSINRMVTYTGRDINDDPVYDMTIPKPTLTFTGTVKLHGTNAGVTYNTEHGMWPQSKENIITIKDDNAGFAKFTVSNKKSFLKLIEQVKIKHDIDTNEFNISIFGEWAGGNIQKNMGISHFDKAFYIFGVKISKPQDIDFTSYWLDATNLRDNDSRIYNIYDFKTYSIEIDFNMPQLVQNKLGDITVEVEKECPVAKQLGFSGMGEGIVWSVTYKDTVHRFKVKGEKHSVSKVKTLAPVDIEKLNSITEFVDYAVTENRFNQALGIIFKDPMEYDVKKMGDVIRWVVGDITAEEMDTMLENKLVPKDVNKYISAKTRTMFFKVLQS